MHCIEPFRAEKCFETFSLVYGRQPAAGEIQVKTTSAANSIDLAFLPSERSIVRRGNGRVETRSFAVGQGGMHGFEPIEFLYDDTPSEYMEIRILDVLLEQVAAELGCATLNELPERHDMSDPVMWSVCTRYRADILGGWPMDPLAAEASMLALTMHLMTAYLDSAPRRATRLPLDHQRLNRINEYVDEHLNGRITIRQLADVALVSPYHLIRSFRAATGLTPYEFVLSKRMERARQAIQLERKSVAAAAASVGYRNAPHFRNAFKRYFGLTPSRLSND
ncbi:MAG: AraC family transcriptional regulator [Pseudomonadota bacterium]